MNFNKELLSIVIAIGLVSLIIGLLSTNAIRFSDVSSAIAYVFVAGIIGILVWGFKSKINSKIKIENKENPHQQRQESIKLQEEKKPETISRKTIKIHRDEYDELKLYRKRGEIIRGEISSDGFFNIYFLTESSYRSFKNESDFQSLDGSEDVSHFEVNFEIPRKAIYHVVLENADKKNIVVTIDLYSK